MPERTLVFVGTFTRPAPFLKTTNGRGIYTFSLDLASGQLSFLSETQGIDDPSYLAIDPTGRYLYATSEVYGWKECTCNAYAINWTTGELNYINKQVTLGGSTTHVSIDRSNRYVLMANYSDGRGAVVLPIRPDGGVAPVSSWIEHPGVGFSQPRQDRSHCHCILADPGNNYVFISDLGLDRLFAYRFDPAQGTLTAHPVGTIKFTDGAGPRHFLFRPDGKFVYLIQELNSTITALSYDADKGQMTPIQTVSALPDGYTGTNSCAAIQISPDGRYLYGSNRGHDSIAIFAIDPASGKLTYVGHQSTKGHAPRDFNIDPTGKFLLAANQDSDTIVTFRIDPATGKLEDTGYITSVGTPVCVKFLQV